jgi:Ca2+ transporting ATPase
MVQPPRGRSERIIDPWTLTRYLLIGGYIGVATVFGFIWYMMYYAMGPTVTWYQLTHFHSCAAGVKAAASESSATSLWQGISSCEEVFHGPALKAASTMALSVLVVIGMPACST